MNILDDPELEPTETPGYWRVKGGCPGGNNCRHAFRGVLGPCDGGTKLTRSYRDSYRENGRFVSPYRTWRKARELFIANQTSEEMLK